ncbi:Rhs element Vgr protein [Chitinophaga terrae (ex Kim and Jung 2007)]|uniref:type VI secretion system Vgr family protein n=1 Tax=Chitinophaga terrae (ex Kim and Jung 2007) TaxID=408074 RepID=UPI0027827DCE|nr:type VI secretion system tip protein VgrG [Chitinophaga terrae (ex Kim and Jung 2007)]MDQ0108272.1 Rhs element Vgr protein [Chitinophaga terrae (ex Kim and Jung 2007)]
MSLNAITHLIIAGRQFSQLRSLKLEQAMSAHHSFSIEMRNEWLIAAGEDMFSSALDYLGKEISVIIRMPENQQGKEQLVFKGLITGVQTGKAGDGTEGYTCLKGGSPTLLMEKLPDMKSYAHQHLSDIVREHTQVCKSWLNQVQITPANDRQLKYSVQYRESSFRYLQRLAAENGEWFFYNGTDLVFGRYTPANRPLTHQVNLLDFEMNAVVSAAKGMYKQYEYRQDKLHTVAWPERNNHAYLTGAVAQISEQLYPASSVCKALSGLTSKADVTLPVTGKHYRQSIVANSVVLKGKSSDPAIRLGDEITISELKGKRYGDFLVVALEHHYTGNGTYYNLFSAIPAASAYPGTALAQPPRCEAQRAVVVENADPRGLGRVKVRFDWQEKDTTPWIRVLTPYAGGERGIYFVPEINDEVWIAFEGDHPELPYVAGAMYNAGTVPEWAEQENNRKAIKTRSGHTIQLDDTAGKEQISITDKSGGKITLDSWDKSISIKAPESLYLEAKQLFINTQENITLCAGENFTCYAGNDLQLQATAACQISAHDAATFINSKQVINAQSVDISAGKVKIESTKEDVELISAGQIDIQSSEKIRMF